MTLLDLKTISTTTRELVKLGLIHDTGERRGKSGRIVVYDLLFDGSNAPKNGTIQTAEIGEKRNDCKHLVASSGDGTGNATAIVTEMQPNFSSNASVFGGECTQKRNDLIVPKTEHRTGVNLEPGFEPGKTEPCRAAGAPLASLPGAAEETPPEKAQGKPASSKDSDWWRKILREGTSLGLVRSPHETKADFETRVARAGNIGAATAAGE